MFHYLSIFIWTILFLVAIFTPLDTHARASQPQFQSNAYFSAQSLVILKALSLVFLLSSLSLLTVYDMTMNWNSSTNRLKWRQWKWFMDFFYIKIWTFCKRIVILHLKNSIFFVGRKRKTLQKKNISNWTEQNFGAPNDFILSIQLRLSFLFHEYVTENTMNIWTVYCIMIQLQHFQ